MRPPARGQDNGAGASHPQGPHLQERGEAEGLLIAGHAGLLDVSQFPQSLPGSHHPPQRLLSQCQGQYGDWAWAGIYIQLSGCASENIVQELRESRGGRPGLSVLTSRLVSVDVKNY